MLITFVAKVSADENRYSIIFPKEYGKEGRRLKGKIHTSNFRGCDQEDMKMFISYEIEQIW
jgi:hypothetical protein